MAKFKQGQSGNLQGRPKGKTNAATDKIKEIITRFLAGNLKNLQKDYDLLKNPNQRLAFIKDLLKFVVPPPQNELEKLDDESLDRLIEKLRNDRLKP